MNEQTAPERKPRKPKKPKRLTRSRLRNITHHYLERYSTTRGHLRRLLQRRVDKSLRFFPDDDRVEMLGWVDALLDHLEATGHLNDRAWATSRLNKLARRGLSERALRAKLREKCVPGPLIDELVAELAPDPREAVARYARRRRLGPFRPPHREADERKELAKLGRAGFSYGLARDLLSMSLEDAEALTDRR